MPTIPQDLDALIAKLRAYQASPYGSRWGLEILKHLTAAQAVSQDYLDHIERLRRTSGKDPAFITDQ